MFSVSGFFFSDLYWCMVENNIILFCKFEELKLDNKKIIIIFVVYFIYNSC